MMSLVFNISQSCVFLLLKIEIIQISNVLQTKKLPAKKKKKKKKKKRKREKSIGWFKRFAIFWF